MTLPRSTRLIAIAVTALTLLGLAHVWVHLQVISLGYEISRETKRRHELSEQNQRLRLELTSRIDPGSVDRVARTELHMGPPDPQNIHVIRTDGARLPVARASRDDRKKERP